ncbi:MAG: Methyltransferase [Gemmataceae bacterium]|nr:Methyltransferase [Gemmataceae bacterium]
MGRTTASQGSEPPVGPDVLPSSDTPGPPDVAYQTPAGRLFVGRAEDVLAAPALDPWRGRVQLVFTSPPFPLHRKKKYGNLCGTAYADWLAGFAGELSRLLTPTGSIVLELGNGWNPGTPTVSTVGIKALLAFQEAANLHLCQEFICYNPARLPTPAEWVSVRRTRVKDAFTRVWWLSPTPTPKADNRRVLTGYSESMQKLLRRGTYSSGRRPSEHRIGVQSFLADNGGAIPPNVLVHPAADEAEPQAVLPIANTASKGGYHQMCRDRNVARHPAAMPESLVDFFVKFLTDPGDVVFDPFAGSNTTGAVAERLGREWVGIEMDPEYAGASRVRFDGGHPAPAPHAAEVSRRTASCASPPPSSPPTPGTRGTGK